MGYAKSAKIAFIADDRQYNAALKRLEAQSAKTIQRLDAIGRTARRSFLLASASAAGLLKLHREQEQAEYQLTAAVKNAGKQRSISIEYVKQYSSALQRSSVYGDEAAIQASVFGIRLGNLNRDQLPRAVRLFADYAAVMGVDLPRASRQLSKYLADPTVGMNRLAQAGIVLDEATKDHIRTMVEQGKMVEAQNYLMGELEKKFGGASEAMLDGTGIIIAMKNSWSDYGEQVGEVLFEYIRPAIFWLKDLAERLKDSDSAAHRTAEAIKKLLIFSAVAAAAAKVIALMYGLRIALIAVTRAATGARLSMATFWTTATLGLAGLVAFWPEISAFWDKFEYRVKLATANLDVFWSRLSLKAKTLLKKILPGKAMAEVVDQAQADLDAALSRRIQARKDLANANAPVTLPGVTVKADQYEDEEQDPHVETAAARRKRLQREKDAYDRQTEIELLRMHLDEVAAVDLEYYERKRELDYERREAERIEDEEIKAAELEKNRLQYEVLEKDRKAHYKRMRKESKRAGMDEAKRLATHLGTIFGMHTAAGKLAFLTQQALKVSEIVMTTPSNAAQAYTNAMAAFPPPGNVAIAKTMYGLTMAAGAAGIAATAAATVQGLKGDKAEGKRAGGMIPGDPTLGDAYPYLLQAGEAVVPRGSYRDLERGIRGRIANEEEDSYDDAPDPGPQQNIVIEFAGDAGQLLRQVQDGNDILRI